MKTYNRLPVTFERGEGCWLIDSNGKRYIDALCGISVTSLGHGHPAFIEAIQSQANKLVHTSNLFHIEAQEKLANSLCDIAQMDRVFFGNSGAEANEAAIKLARLHAHNNGNHDPLILTFRGSFHGRTLGTLAATGNTAIKEGFEPLLPGFAHLTFNDENEVTQYFAEHKNIAAVLIEPVQGEGGIHIATPHFLHKLQTLCHEHGALFMLDEIQSGNGRCGRYFAFQCNEGTTYALKPDVVTTAKGLGNGFPIGACLARGAAADTMAPGKHGSTFGGNPLACHVANAVINTIMEQQLANKAASTGEWIASNIQNNLANNPIVKEIRYCGLMIGIELNKTCVEIMQMGLDEGIVLNVTAGNVVRLLPPLTTSQDEAIIIVNKVSSIILTFADNKK